MITYRTECWFIIRKISRLRFLDSEFYSLVRKLIIQRIPGVRSDSDGSRSVRDRCSRTASLISRRSLIRGSRYDAALWPREYKHSARNQLKKEKGESCGRERLERKKNEFASFPTVRNKLTVSDVVEKRENLISIFHRSNGIRYTCKLISGWTVELSYRNRCSF